MRIVPSRAPTNNHAKTAGRRSRRLPGPGYDVPLHEGKTVAVEKAYRRGYHQALADAVRALKAGAKLHDFTGWERQIDDWRTTDTHRVIFPPPPPRWTA